MGCSSCGNKRKKYLKKFDAPLLDATGKKISDSFLDYSQRQRVSKKKTIPRTSKSVGGGVVDLSQLKNIDTLPRISGRYNILKHSAKGMSVYVIAHFKGCSSCKYMLRLIDKSITPEIAANVSFYKIEKNDVQANGFEFRNNPTVVLVDRGKTVRQISGMYPNIQKVISDFSNKIEEKTIKKSLSSDKSPWVVKLKPNPTHVDAYEKLLESMGKKKDRIKNITTFLDQKANLLVVTMDFK